MNKLKTIIATLLYLSSVAVLLIAAGSTSKVLSAYGLDYPATLGKWIPAFTQGSLDILVDSAWLCGGTAAVSTLLLLVALRKATTRESKLYWTAVLAAINYNVAAGVYYALVVGYFLLPKLSNAA